MSNSQCPGTSRAHDTLSEPPLVLHSNVLVIGAGPSGLATAKACLDAGLQVTVLEQASSVGGWSCDGDSSQLLTGSTTSSLYFSDSALAKAGKEQTAESARAHLACYAAFHSLADYIRLSCRLTHLVLDPALANNGSAAASEPAATPSSTSASSPSLSSATGGRWRATFDDLAQGQRYQATADFVVLCTGHAGAGAAVEGLAEAGSAAAGVRCLHVKQATMADIPARRGLVMVVGDGAAAVDCASAVALLREGKDVRLLIRSAPSTVTSAPPSTFCLMDGSSLLDSARRRALHAALQPHYTSPAPGAVGRAVIAPTKRRFWALLKGKAGAAVLGDNRNKAASTASAAAVSTSPPGFQPSNTGSCRTRLLLWAPSFSDPRVMPFLDPALRRALLGGEQEADPAGDLLLYRGVLPPGVRGLAFVGYEAHSRSSLLVLELQAQWLVAHLTARLALPPPAAMRADVEAQRAWRAAALASPLMSANGSLAARHERRYVQQLAADLAGIVELRGPTSRIPAPLITNATHLRTPLQPGTPASCASYPTTAPTNVTPSTFPSTPTLAASSPQSPTCYQAALQMTSVPPSVVSCPTRPAASPPASLPSTPAFTTTATATATNSPQANHSLACFQAFQMPTAPPSIVSYPARSTPATSFPSTPAFRNADGWGPAHGSQLGSPNAPFRRASASHDHVSAWAAAASQPSVRIDVGGRRRRSSDSCGASCGVCGGGLLRRLGACLDRRADGTVSPRSPMWGVTKPWTPSRLSGVSAPGNSRNAGALSSEGSPSSTSAIGRIVGGLKRLGHSALGRRSSQGSSPRGGGGGSGSSVASSTPRRLIRSEPRLMSLRVISPRVAQRVASKPPCPSSLHTDSAVAGSAGPGTPASLVTSIGSSTPTDHGRPGAGSFVVQGSFIGRLRSRNSSSHNGSPRGVGVDAGTAGGNSGAAVTQISNPLWQCSEASGPLPTQDPSGLPLSPKVGNGNGADPLTTAPQVVAGGDSGDSSAEGNIAGSGRGCYASCSGHATPVRRGSYRRSATSALTPLGLLGRAQQRQAGSSCDGAGAYPERLRRFSRSTGIDLSTLMELVSSDGAMCVSPEVSGDGGANARALSLLVPACKVLSPQGAASAAADTDRLAGESDGDGECCVTTNPAAPIRPQAAAAAVTALAANSTEPAPQNAPARTGLNHASQPSRQPVSVDCAPTQRQLRPPKLEIPTQLDHLHPPLPTAPEPRRAPASGIPPGRGFRRELRGSDRFEYDSSLHDNGGRNTYGRAGGVGGGGGGGSGADDGGGQQWGFRGSNASGGGAGVGSGPSALDAIESQLAALRTHLQNPAMFPFPAIAPLLPPTTPSTTAEGLAAGPRRVSAPFGTPAISPSIMHLSQAQTVHGSRDGVAWPPRPRLTPAAAPRLTLPTCEESPTARHIEAAGLPSDEEDERPWQSVPLHMLRPRTSPLFTGVDVDASDVPVMGAGLPRQQQHYARRPPVKAASHGCEAGFRAARRGSRREIGSTSPHSVEGLAVFRQGLGPALATAAQGGQAPGCAEKEPFERTTTGTTQLAASPARPLPPASPPASPPSASMSATASARRHALTPLLLPSGTGSGCSGNNSTPLVSPVAPLACLGTPRPLPTSDGRATPGRAAGGDRHSGPGIGSGPGSNSTSRRPYRRRGTLANLLLSVTGGGGGSGGGGSGGNVDSDEEALGGLLGEAAEAAKLPYSQRLSSPTPAARKQSLPGASPSPSAAPPSPLSLPPGLSPCVSPILAADSSSLVHDPPFARCSGAGASRLSREVSAAGQPPLAPARQLNRHTSSSSNRRSFRSRLWIMSASTDGTLEGATAPEPTPCQAGARSASEYAADASPTLPFPETASYPAVSPDRTSVVQNAAQAVRGSATPEGGYDLTIFGSARAAAEVAVCVEATPAVLAAPAAAAVEAAAASALPGPPPQPMDSYQTGHTTEAEEDAAAEMEALVAAATASPRGPYVPSPFGLAGRAAGPADSAPDTDECGPDDTDHLDDNGSQAGGEYLDLHALLTLRCSLAAAQAVQSARATATAVASSGADAEAPPFAAAHPGGGSTGNEIREGQRVCRSAAGAPAAADVTSAGPRVPADGAREALLVPPAAAAASADPGAESAGAPERGSGGGAVREASRRLYALLFPQQGPAAPRGAMRSLQSRSQRPGESGQSPDLSPGPSPGQGQGPSLSPTTHLQRLRLQTQYYQQQQQQEQQQEREQARQHMLTKRSFLMGLRRASTAGAGDALSFKTLTVWVEGLPEVERSSRGARSSAAGVVCCPATTHQRSEPLPAPLSHRGSTPTVSALNVDDELLNAARWWHSNFNRFKTKQAQRRDSHLQPRTGSCSGGSGSGKQTFYQDTAGVEGHGVNPGGGGGGGWAGGGGRRSAEAAERSAHGGCNRAAWQGSATESTATWDAAVEQQQGAVAGAGAAADEAPERRGPAWVVRRASQARQEQLVREIASRLRGALARKATAAGAGVSAPSPSTPPAGHEQVPPGGADDGGFEM